MPKYKIFAGLGGGFGGAIYRHTTDENYTEDEANKEAYETAIEVYESYAGMNGLMDYSEALQEAEKEVSEDDYDDDSDYQSKLEVFANNIYNENIESWLDYYVKLDDGIEEE